MSFLGWLFSIVFAFSLGAGLHSDKPADSELKQKVQEHMDVIVDEGAAMVDDVIEEVRSNEHVQEAEQFRDDVKEIVDNTIDDIHEHFGRDEEEETEELQETEVVETEAVETEAETAG